MLKLTIEDPAEIPALLEALRTYLTEQADQPAKRSAQARFIHDDAGRLVSVAVELDKSR
jgi:hypothetical protein